MDNVIDITLPHLGLIERMPAEQYFRIKALSNSGMSDLARCPYIYRMRQDQDEHATPVDAEESKQLFNGTLTHCLTLEPDEFEQRYVVGPEEARNTKTWKQFIGEYQGKVGIKPSEHQRALGQATSVRAVPLVAQALSKGKPELSVFWKERVELDAGLVVEVLCKARLDWLHHVGTREAPAAVILDLKTTSDATKRGFEMSIAKYHYYRQAAWYARGFTAATGIPVVGFLFAIVESLYPYAATAGMLDDAALEKGAAECDRLLRLAAQCQHSGEWPGYPADIQLFSLPAWAMKEAA